MSQETNFKLSLESEIRSAFRGVRLGSGIGLLEGQAIDNWCSDQEQKLARSNDEQHEWEKIPPDRLRACESSLSFFDAEGMLFHLPAFMIAEVNNNLSIGIEFTLTHAPYMPEKFSLLNDAQRHAVRMLLQYMESIAGHRIQKEEISRAIELYWRKSKNEV